LALVAPHPEQVFDDEMTDANINADHTGRVGGRRIRTFDLTGQ
jgi:hypothetical protein